MESYGYEGRCFECGCYVEEGDQGCRNRACAYYEEPADGESCWFIPMDVE